MAVSVVAAFTPPLLATGVEGGIIASFEVDAVSAFVDAKASVLIDSVFSLRQLFSLPLLPS